MDSTIVLYMIGISVLVAIVFFVLGFETAKKIIANKLDKESGAILMRAYKLGHIAALKKYNIDKTQEIKDRIDTILDDEANEEPQ